jgi:hypothetical protein
MQMHGKIAPTAAALPIPIDNLSVDLTLLSLNLHK